jgi:pilus assembly protein Flp/PilA
MVSILKKEIANTKKQRGATMVEYAIMVALIAIVAIAAVTTLGTNTSTTFQSAADVMPAG